MNTEATMCPTCFEVPPTMLPDDRVALLMRISEQALANPRVRRIALQLRSMLADKLGRAPTQAEIAQWLADAGHLLVEYKPDPAGMEVFQSVEYTLGGAASLEVSPITGRPKGVGDCEDLAGAFVALALALGLQARVRWWTQKGAPLNHVAAEVKLNGQWVNVETTIPGAHVGETPYQALDRVGPDYRSRIFGLREAAGGVFAPAGDPGGSDGVIETPLEPSEDAGTIYITHMPRSGRVLIDGVETSGNWGVLPPAGDRAPNSLGAAGDQVFIVEMWPGVHTLSVMDGERTIVSQSIDMPNGAQNPRGNRITVDAATSTTLAPLRVVNMPPGGNVVIDGRSIEGTWLDASYTVWVVNTTVGPHAVQVRYPDGAVRSAQITIPPGGTSINASNLTAVDTRPAATVLRVFYMPAGGRVQIDGVETDGRWTDTDYIEWDVPITQGSHEVRVFAADGTAKAQTVDVGPDGVTVDYPRMAAATRSTSHPDANATRMALAGSTPGAGGGRGRGRGSRAGARGTPLRGANADRAAVANSSPGVGGTLTLPGVQQQDGAQVQTATLGLVHMPPYGGVFVDGTQVQGGSWDTAQTTWYISVAPGRHEVRVVAPANAWTRTVSVDVPATGTSVDVGQAAATASLVTLALVRMPPYGTAFVDGTRVDGAWNADQTAWLVQVTPGRREVRVVAPANAWTRSVTVDVGASGASVDVGQVDTAGTDKQPAPPVADATTVDLVLHADNCNDYTTVTLRNVTTDNVVSTTHESIVGSVRPTGGDMTGQCMENWRTSVAPGSYMVRVVLRNGRDGSARITVPITARSQVVALSELAWRWAPAGRVIVHNVPRVPAPTLASSSRSERTVYTVTLTPLGGDAESAISLPLDGSDYVGFAAPGPYTLNVNESVGSTSTVYYTQRVNVRDGDTTDVYAVAPHADSAPPADSGMAAVRLVGLPVNWTFAMGNAVATAMPVSRPEPLTRSAGAVASDSASSARVDPAVAAIIAANQAGLIRRSVAGQELTFGEPPVVTLPLGAGVAELTSPRGVVVHVPIVVDSPAASVDLSYDVERALRYASALRGITGVQPANGARVGYLSDAADVASRQSGLRGGTKPLGEVVEFEALSDRPDTLGRVPTVIFVKNQGLQVAMVTPREMQRVKNQIQFLRTHINSDATYPFEFGQ